MSTTEEDSFVDVEAAALDTRSSGSSGTVEVQLPFHFHTTTDHNPEDRKPPAIRQQTLEDPSVVSSWSMVSTAAFSGGTPSAAAAAASISVGDDASQAASCSTISGFDLVSLTNDGQKTCPTCTFLNHSNASHCEMCQFSFDPNHSAMTSDAILAKALQQEEQDDVLAEIPEPLLSNAQSLTNNILSVVEACYLKNAFKNSSPIALLEVPPEANLTRLASFFLTARGDTPIQLCYCFTTDTPLATTQIYQTGFRPYVLFGSTPEAAVKAYYGKGYHRIQPGLRNRHEENVRGRGCTGTPISRPPAVRWDGWWPWWAVQDKDGGDYQVKVESGTSWICRRPGVGETLPLVQFPADQMETDVLRRLWNGLVQVFTPSKSQKFWDKEIARRHYAARTRSGGDANMPALPVRTKDTMGTITRGWLCTGIGDT